MSRVWIIAFQRLTKGKTLFGKYINYCFTTSSRSKVKKLCVIGPPNSGKTTWFAPITGIIGSENIASVTREGKFAAHLIDQNTEVVLMDEWSSGMFHLNIFVTLCLNNSNIQLGTEFLLLHFV